MLARLARLPLLVVLLGVTGVLAQIPAVHALTTDDNNLARAFFYSGLVLLVLAAMLGIATAGFRPRNVSRSHLGSLVGAYLLLPFAMLLPLTEAVPDTSLINAWFEMTSALTTTGASVFAPDRLSDSIHLWRATMGWFGGYLILLGAYAILAPLNLGGFEVASGRVPGRGATSLPQAGELGHALRMTRIAFRILPLYLVLTAFLWFGLLLAGESATTALIHAMGTLSTSGIAGQGALGAGVGGVPAEALVLVFLIFALSHRTFKGLGIGRTGPLGQDPEIRLALFILASVSLIFVLRHLFTATGTADGPGFFGIFPALWGTLFTATSFLTTTGYVSALWPSALDWSGIGTPGLILLGLALFGGGVATTAGGVKLLRVYALLRQGERELERIIHPASVGGGGSDARRLRGDGALAAWVFFILFAVAIAVILALLLLLGLAFEPALVLTLAALTTTGPLAEVASTAPISYADLSDSVKLTLGLAMIVGRLETLALFALVLPLTRRDA